MRSTFILCLIGAFVLSAQAYEELWQISHRAQAHERHSIIIAVKLQADALATCDSLLMDVSDPSSSNYGKYLSLEEVGKLTVDTQANRAVKNWLRQQNVAFEATQNGDFIIVESTVGQIEDLIAAEFYHYTSKFTTTTIKRTELYAVPREVAPFVDFISNTVNFPPARTAIMAARNPAQQGSVSPSTINTAYSVGSNVVASPKSTQSVFEGLGQSFDPADLASFEQQFNIPNEKVFKVIGPNSPSACSNDPNNCGEASLDIQYLIAVAQKSPSTFWSINANDPDPFVSWIVAVGNDSNPPLVHSMSYGSIAQEDPTHDKIRFNTEACKLGLRGVTIMIASGDDGVANYGARNNQSACGFNPSWPATCPYVTAVGATQGPESGTAEVACCSNTGGLITTGGGFSYYYPQPSYQNAAVTNYLKTAPALPPASMFNPQGRAYPDVAVLGYNYNVVIGGSTYQVSGTSASTPVFAALVTLVNGLRLAANKAPLGFLNPALYALATSTPAAFNDITVGRNNCCAQASVCCSYAFNATTGWDPLTGMGSVNFPTFSKALEAL